MSSERTSANRPKSRRKRRKTVRLRHFTSISGLNGIRTDNVIKAGDRGRVFAVRARGRSGSPRDVERALGIRRGRGNAFIEFDASPSEFVIKQNPDTGATEYIIQGDVGLTERGPEFLMINR